MWPYLALMCVMAIGVGLWASDRTYVVDGTSTPSSYTIDNIRQGDQYHVEQGGQTQDFEILATHWSGYFQIRVLPPEGHELDRDYPAVTGWTRELLANRLIEAGNLLEELPFELRVPSYN